MVRIHDVSLDRAFWKWLPVNQANSVSTQCSDQRLPPADCPWGDSLRSDVTERKVVSKHTTPLPPDSSCALASRFDLAAESAATTVLSHGI